MVCYNKLMASGAGAIIVGALLFYLEQTRPLWRSAAMVALGALAAYYAYTYAFPPECPECVPEEAAKKQQKTN